MSGANSCREIFHRQLHLTYRPRHFDNWFVWAGNLSIDLEGRFYPSKLARVYIDPRRPSVEARVQVELFVAAIPAAQVREGAVDVRLWTDANDRVVETIGASSGQAAAALAHGRHIAMRLRCGNNGAPLLSGQNLQFESDPLHLEKTGVFSYTVQFSGDAHEPNSPHKAWVSLNDIAENEDGLIVVSPEWVRQCPSVMEVCTRKTGATTDAQGRFVSGRFAHVTDRLERLPVDVVYLLPFFKPGYFDLHTGQDVRKGQLGSPYAVADFFALDPDLVTPPEQADLRRLVGEGLIVANDLLETEVPLASSAELADFDALELMRRWGRDNLIQLLGRAELRALTRRAHELGKRVIFDLVLAQTSRDNPLIRTNPEWYITDDEGRPSIHQIAWLVYSDVALLDLTFNEPLQEYLLGVAPYWMQRCDLDGVRIDASQTLDRPFLKRIKNRINAIKEDALVLGETLCPLQEATDVPADMIYALVVDLHRDVATAEPLIRLLEEMHSQLPAHTVAMAYFENHDSPRATRVWHERFSQACADELELAAQWALAENPPAEDHPPLTMALLKNLQASLINATAGMAASGANGVVGAGTNLVYGLELGSEWGEEAQTDFENECLLGTEASETMLGSRLSQSYGLLKERMKEWNVFRTGLVYYHRNEFEGGDPEDLVFAYCRYDEDDAALVIHNLDFRRPRTVRFRCDYLAKPVAQLDVIFDTYEVMGLAVETRGGNAMSVRDGWVELKTLPLQTRILQLR